MTFKIPERIAFTDHDDVAQVVPVLLAASRPRSKKKTVAIPKLTGRNSRGYITAVVQAVAAGELSAIEARVLLYGVQLRMAAAKDDVRRLRHQKSLREMHAIFERESDAAVVNAHKAKLFDEQERKRYAEMGEKYD